MDEFTSSVRREGEGEENSSSTRTEGESNALDESNDVSLSIPSSLPDPSTRRHSAILQKNQAGCYLLYDQTQVKTNYLAGICTFFKLIRDFKADLTLLPSAEEVELKAKIILGLKDNLIIRYDKYDSTYKYLELDCIAVVSKQSVVLTAKQMQAAVFMAKAAADGFALSLK